MAPSRQVINYFAFNSGELSPYMANRQDQARYAYGVKRMSNFMPMLQGPARKRPGVRFVCEIADSAQRAWLVPFVFAQRDAWLLEFGDETLRFISDQGQVTEATKTITGITTAAQAVVTSNAHGFLDGDEVVIAGVVGLLDANGKSIINGRNFRISDKTANTFKLKDLYGVYLSSATATAYGSAGTAARVYAVVSPFTIASLTNSDTDCFTMSFAQSGDVLDICVSGERTQQLTRSASTSWAFSDFEPDNGPFETVDPDQTITVYSSHETGSARTLTASSAIFTADHVGSLFLLEKKLTDTVTAWEVGKAVVTSDVRRSQGHYYIALNSATTGTITPTHTEGARYDGDTGVQWQYLHSGYGWAKITAIGGGGTTATVDILSRIPAQAVGSGNASTRWAFGSWSDAYGWPTHVSYFRERKVFARDTRLWGSVPADFDNFAQRDAGVAASDSAFDIDIRSGVNDTIVWMVASSDLLVGTEGGEFSVGEISSADPLGPDNIAALSGPGYGSRQVTPCTVNDAVMYVLPSGRTMRELRFTFETDGYSALNRTAFAEHILKGRAIQLAYQKEPESIVWAACADGSVAAMSYEREHDLVAWHRHTFGASAEIESVAVIPAPDGARDEVYLIGKMTVNGQTKRYLGFIEEHWDPDADEVEDQFYVDWGLTYEGAATSILTGLHHLEGKSVQVWGTGATGSYDLGDFTVVNGQVDLGEASVTKAQVGLGYTATLESMNVVRPGVLARAVKVWVRFIATIAAAWQTVTQRRDTLETSTSRSFEMGNITVSAGASPVTRLVQAAGESGNGYELRWLIVHDRPTYCNVAGVIPALNTESGG
ncbi:MAG: hypothetical protein AB7P35_17690 [Hyphomonadaceae bacterium]